MPDFAWRRRYPRRGAISLVLRGLCDRACIEVVGVCRPIGARVRDFAATHARRLLRLLLGALAAIRVGDLVDDDLLSLVEHGVVRDPVDPREVVAAEAELLRDI